MEGETRIPHLDALGAMYLFLVLLLCDRMVVKCTVKTTMAMATTAAITTMGPTKLEEESPLPLLLSSLAQTVFSVGRQAWCTPPRVSQVLHAAQRVSRSDRQEKCTNWSTSQARQGWQDVAPSPAAKVPDAQARHCSSGLGSADEALSKVPGAQGSQGVELLESVSLLPTAQRKSWQGPELLAGTKAPGSQASQLVAASPS
jgi:hypothetical protein